MPYREPESSDPHELVGVELPGDAASTREMACAFAEEFARGGWSAERILVLFRSPAYRASHAALRELGEPAVRSIVDEAVALWGGLRVVVTEPVGGAQDPPRGRRRLRVL